MSRRRMHLYCSTLALALAALAGCSGVRPQPAPCGKVEIAAIDLSNGDGSLDRGFVGGVSFIDIDGDGDTDLMVTRGYDPSEKNRPFHNDRSMMYRNDGAGRFIHDPDNPLSNADDADSGSTWADVDHDGDLDAFVSTQNNHVDRFYRNLGSGRFAREELGDATSTPGSNFSSTWADFDADGDLDLISGGPALSRPEPNLVFRNENGSFERISPSPLEGGASNSGAVLWADVDNDGDQDAFIAYSDIIRMNNLEPAVSETPQLLFNDKGRYTRSTGQGFDDPAYPATGAAFADIDNDGDLDLLLQVQPGGDLPDGKIRSMRDRLFRNDGSGHYALEPSFVGPEHTDVNGGAVFADIDLDGDQDLLITNFDRPLSLYLNNGHGEFVPEKNPTLDAMVGPHTSLASADIDGDGDIDFALGRWDEDTPHYVSLLVNNTMACGKALRVRVHDRHGTPDPVGARVTLITRGPHGLRKQMREAMAQTGFRSQNGDQMFFGVPDHERIESLEVRWPQGGVDTIRDPRFDTLNEVTQAAR